MRVTMLLVTACWLSLAGCASRMARQDQEEQQQAAKQAATQATAPAPENPRATQLAQLAMSARLDAMETKLAAMNDKLDATRASLDNFLSAHPSNVKSVGVPSQAADTIGTPVASTPVATDSESGYINDPAIQQYRKAQILLDSQKYADSILYFSKFLEKNPDHPLAGSAQFHIGEAYAKQKEWRMADQELQKVLTSYDRSIHVADTLRIMADAEEHLGKTQEAARHRQQLSSLFASSPAAAQLTSSRAQPAEPEAAVAPAALNAPAAPPVKPTGEKPALDEPPPTAPVTTPATAPVAPAETTEKTLSE